MRRQVAFQTSATSAQDEGADEIIGLSEPMREVYKLIGRLAASDLPVLITGRVEQGRNLSLVPSISIAGGEKNRF